MMASVIIITIFFTFAATELQLLIPFNTSPQSFLRYLLYTKFMCHASQPVTRKVFDYNAYIQGRLRGEYVVIYHTVIEEPEDVTSDIQLDITDVQISVQKTMVIPIITFKNSIDSDLIWATTISRDIFSDYYYYTTSFIPLTKITSVNCRGAPQ